MVMEDDGSKRAGEGALKPYDADSKTSNTSCALPSTAADTLGRLLSGRTSKLRSLRRITIGDNCFVKIWVKYRRSE